MVSSLRLDRNLVTINPTAEKARSASKEVGGRVFTGFYDISCFTWRYNLEEFIVTCFLHD